MSKYYLGIEIGGTKLQVVLGDQKANIVERSRMAVDGTEGAAGIQRQIEQAVETLSARYAASAVGVGFGGPIDVRSGRILLSHHVEGWAGFEIRTWLEELTGLPVEVDNDANTAALGEARKGAGVGLDPVFYVTLGSGMGGGLVAGGEIYHGAVPGEAEIGLMAFDREGNNFESRCAGWAMDRRIQEQVAEYPSGALAELVDGKSRGQARFLAAAIERGDKGALILLEETAADIAFALSHVTHLLHPEVIILGGGLSLIGEPLRQRVADALAGFLARAFRPSAPDVRLARLGEDVVGVGALLLARQARGE